MNREIFWILAAWGLSLVVFWVMGFVKGEKQERNRTHPTSGAARMSDDAPERIWAFRSPAYDTDGNQPQYWWDTEVSGAIEYHRAPRWIPVSERLPKFGHMVLVAGGIAEYRTDGIWYSLVMSRGRPIQWEVTHWQPLPPPPAETPE